MAKKHQPISKERQDELRLIALRITLEQFPGDKAEARFVYDRIGELLGLVAEERHPPGHAKPAADAL